MAPQSSAWYRGNPRIVSYGDTIEKDPRYDNLTQLSHCDDEHLGVVDSDYICEDCDTKKLEEQCYDAEVEEGDFGDATEPLPSAGYRGDPCIDSYGDAIDEDLCYENPTQLEHCTMGAVGDVKEHELVCYDAEVKDSDFGDAQEHEVGYHDVEVEDCAFFYTEEYEEESYDADVEECHYY